MSEQPKPKYTEADLKHALAVLISDALARGENAHSSIKVLLENGREYQVTVQPLAMNCVPFRGWRLAGFVGREN